MSYWSAVKGKISDAKTRILRLDASTHAMKTIAYEHAEVHSGSHFFINGHASLGVGGTYYFKLTTSDTAKWGHFTWKLNSTGILVATLDEDATGGMAGGLGGNNAANNRNIDCWTGTHTGGDDEATVLTDATQSWTPDALIGMTVFNLTDQSSGVITDNDATSVTVAALAGGTGNDFDTDDAFEINKSLMTVLVNGAVADSYRRRLLSQSFGSKSAGGASEREDEIVLKQNTVYQVSFTSSTASNLVGWLLGWYEHTDKN